MKNIIVAGAGHGGLLAAAELAKKGFHVTVYEKKAKNELGHDWEDRFTFEALCKYIGLDDVPAESWRYRGDCAFVSPSHNTSVIINYTQENRQKIMWRKSVMNLLIQHAYTCGVEFEYETNILGPIVKDNKVLGLQTSVGDFFADMVIDSAGVFSPVRSNLPDSCGICKDIQRGDVFYAYRAYYNKNDASVRPDVPFEVYLYHECEQGLSWCCTNEDSVDILIGRIDPLTQEKVDEQLAIFKKNHPYIGDDILHGGCFGTIPVRRPLSVMVCDGYAAVGDSAFMTTPMNGMGIDLSLHAGALLAKTVRKCNGEYSANNLWPYNRDFHVLYGGETARNEGLKNSLLELPPEGVDFLLDNAVIQSSDLAGAGRNTNLGSLLGKFVRGMKNPPYFFAILNGLLKGGKVSSTLKKVPNGYDKSTVEAWAKQIEKNVIKINRIVK